MLLTANVVEDLVRSAINVSDTVEATSVGMQKGKIVLNLLSKRVINHIKL